MSKKQASYLDILALMREEVISEHFGDRAEETIIERGEQLRNSSLSPTDQLVTLRLLDSIVDRLSPEGDRRKVRAYLKTLIKDMEGPTVPISTCLGRTA